MQDYKDWVDGAGWLEVVEKMAVLNIVEGGVSDVAEGFAESTNLLIGAGVFNERRKREGAVEGRVVEAGLRR